MSDKDLRRGLKILGLTNSGPQVEILERYLDEIKKWNPAYKLVANTKALSVRHILDSLAPLNIIQELHPKSMADLGSGAGLPGIPLSLWLPQTQFTLVERSERRAGFLHNMIATLGLKNVIVCEDDIKECLNKSDFDMVIFRALAPLDSPLVRHVSSALKPGSRILAYKGRLKVVQQELASVKWPADIYPLNIPFLNEKRCFVVIDFAEPCC